jgi:hypothetical protein
MYSKILKKKKKEIEGSAPEAKPLYIGKKAAEHTMKSMAPMEKEDSKKDSMEDAMEDAMEEKKKSILPEAKIEIELMIENAKKKKSKEK